MEAWEARSPLRPQPKPYATKANATSRAVIVDREPFSRLPLAIDADPPAGLLTSLT
jgi:hypothetical protein